MADVMDKCSCERGMCPRLTVTAFTKTFFHNTHQLPCSMEYADAMGEPGMRGPGIDEI